MATGAVVSAIGGVLRVVIRRHDVVPFRQAVARVRSTKKAQALSPMTSYERRVVHMELASMPDIVTESGRVIAALAIGGFAMFMGFMFIRRIVDIEV